MQESTLPSPNVGGRGHHLRRVAAATISQIEVNAAAYGNGRHPSATEVVAFFQACLDAATLLIPAVTTMTFTPTAKTYSLAAGVAGAIEPVLDRGGHTGVPVWTSSDPTKATVNASTGEITPIASSGTTTITATFPANGGYATQTKTYVATLAA